MELVSILVPAYKPRHFREALTSAIAQTWRNKEIIVSDDCPSEEIHEICNEYTGHVTYIRNPYPGKNGRKQYQIPNECRQRKISQVPIR